jgi:Icc-related predicted phosphoesterase
LEWGPLTLEPAGEDLIVLAGDIGVHTTAIGWIKETAQRFDVPVVVIAGNHEFYTSQSKTARKKRKPPSHSWESTIADLRRAADHTDKLVKGAVTFLENAGALYLGVRFVGATLWTDMQLFGDDPLVAMLIASKLNDYETIYHDDGRRLSMSDVVQRHHESREFIADFLAAPFAGPTVVVTHHAPSGLSIPDRYKEDRVSAAYASRLEELILRCEPQLWIHGHQHTSSDYKIGTTRVVSNPRGYYPFELNETFNPDMVITL